ncbi:MAG: hypothetical protein HY043_11025 [Verrucomicrobia bacterium]|nr:hypothetical protein [Verrucomicrobiota bacterium]
MMIAAARSMAPSAPMTARLLVVDGHAYAYRAFYAIRSLNSPSGAATNAIYGFIKMLAKMRALLEPTHVVVVWDGGLSEQRTASLPGYKAQRPPMPEDLGHQIEEIETYLAAARITSLCDAGVEADDRIATLTRHAVAAGANVVIASSDKDFMQLVSPQVGLLNPNDKSETIWSNEQVLAKTGVRPEQIVDWLSLIGDSVDNIPGVTGVGPKTATELIRQYGSAAGVFEKVGEIRSEKLRANLLAAREAVERNQRLIRLLDDLDGGFSFDNFADAAPDVARLRELYERWGFRSLRQELEAAPAAQSEFF